MTTASAPRSGSPADLTITPRDRRFVDKVRPARWWNGGDPVATALYNALSATFPKGEAIFVESVRQFREGAPDKLAEEIKAGATPGAESPLDPSCEGKSGAECVRSAASEP